MKKPWVIAAVVGVLIAGLAAFKPSPREATSYLMNWLRQAEHRSVDPGDWQHYVADQMLTRMLNEEMVTRDFGVAAVYSFTNDGKTRCLLAVGGHFYEL
jgi:hypothetical protein